MTRLLLGRTVHVAVFLAAVLGVVIGAVITLIAVTTLNG